MDRRLIFALAAVAVTGSAAGWLWSVRDAIDPDDQRQVARGAEVYAAHCAECHGPGLEGQPDWRVRKPNGELPAPPHDASGHTWHHGDEYLFSVTKYGMTRVAPPDYKSAMPAFIGRLSDGDIRSVLAYIKSRWPDEVRRRQREIGRR